MNQISEIPHRLQVSLALYRGRQWHVIPTERGTPGFAGWQKKETEAPPFKSTSGIGVVLGPSGLVDVDLDCPEAVMVAGDLLPQGAVFGRDSRPSSHRVYRSQAQTRQAFDDPDLEDARKMIVELRAGPHYTIFPGSVSHKDGLEVRWEGSDEPPKCDSDEIDRACRAVAIAVVVGRSVGYGQLHDASLALAGALAHGGWSQAEGNAIVAAAMKVAGAKDDHAADVESTFVKHEDGKPVSSSKLQEFVSAARMAKLRSWIGGDPSGRTVVLVGDNIAKNADQAIASLRDADVFDYGGRLVRIVGDAQVQPLKKDSLLDELSRAMTFKKGKRVVVAPENMIGVILARGVWPQLRKLQGVSTIPVLRADGSVHDAQGYDEASGVWFCGRAMEVGHTREEAAMALHRLLGATANSWFTSEMDHLAWVAHLVTHAVRSLIKGPTPAFLYSANEQGSGKTTLAQIAAWVTTGVETPAITARMDTEEWSKTLFSYADQPALLIDNLRSKIQSVDLESAILSGRLTARLMREQQGETRVWCPVVALTSNGATAGKDMLRRIMPVRLEKRTVGAQYRGALIDGLNRFEMARDALTIVRAYLMSGEVERVQPWTSFEAWSSVVAAPFVWLGLPDLSEWRSGALDEADVEGEDHENVHAAIVEWRGYGGEFTAQELCAPAMGHQAALRDLQDTIRCCLGLRASEGLSPKLVGSKLSKLGISSHGTLKCQRRAGNKRVWHLESAPS